MPLPNSERIATHAARGLDTPTGTAIEAPPVDPSWHPQAQVWFLGLVGTPQACSYTRADWSHAHTAAAILSGCFHTGDFRTAAATLETAAKQLMTTRPARLAARLDIEEATSGLGEVIELPTDGQLRDRSFGRPG